MKPATAPLPEGVADLAMEFADAVTALNQLRDEINDNMRDNIVPTQETMAAARAAILEASAIHERLAERAQGLDARLDKQLQVDRAGLQHAMDNVRDIARIFGMDTQ